MSHTKCVESFRGGVGWSFCEGSRLIPWMTSDKSLIVVEAVSSGITCPNLLIRFSARCGWTVVKLLVSLPIWSASLLFIDTTQTPLKFQNFQISYKRQGKRKRVTEFVKYCHPESSIMCQEPYLDIMLHDEEDDMQLHPCPRLGWPTERRWLPLRMEPSPGTSLKFKDFAV